MPSCCAWRPPHAARHQARTKWLARTTAALKSVALVDFEDQLRASRVMSPFREALAFQNLVRFPTSSPLPHSGSACGAGRSVSAAARVSLHDARTDGGRDRSRLAHSARDRSLRSLTASRICAKCRPCLFAVASLNHGAQTCSRAVLAARGGRHGASDLRLLHPSYRTRGNEVFVVGDNGTILHTSEGGGRRPPDRVDHTDDAATPAWSAWSISTINFA